MHMFPCKHTRAISFLKSCSEISHGNANIYPIIPNLNDWFRVWHVTQSSLGPIGTEGVVKPT